MGRVVRGVGRQVWRGGWIVERGVERGEGDGLWRGAWIVEREVSVERWRGGWIEEMTRHHKHDKIS